MYIRHFLSPFFLFCTFLHDPKPFHPFVFHRASLVSFLLAASSPLASQQLRSRAARLALMAVGRSRAVLGSQARAALHLDPNAPSRTLAFALSGRGARGARSFADGALRSVSPAHACSFANSLCPFSLLLGLPLPPPRLHLALFRPVREGAVFPGLPLVVLPCICISDRSSLLSCTKHRARTPLATRTTPPSREALPRVRMTSYASLLFFSRRSSVHSSPHLPCTSALADLSRSPSPVAAHALRPLRRVRQAPSSPPDSSAPSLPSPPSDTPIPDRDSASF